MHLRSRLTLVLAPISALIVRWLGARRTATVASLTAVTGVILTGYADTAWHVFLSFSVLTCNLPNDIQCTMYM